MTLIRLTLLFAAGLLLTSCKSQIISPKNLDEAIQFFQQEWTNVELDKFKNTSESDAVSDHHFETGLWIRNNWIHGARDTSLINYFHSLGINHPDDISSIILTSLHRTLNGKDIELNLQAKHYEMYWAKIRDCEDKQKAIAVSSYARYTVSDTIIVRMPVALLEDSSENAFLYGCPESDWTFNKNKDLLLKGIITNKYFINDTTNVFFTIRILTMNRNSMKILMKEAKSGDEREFSLAGLTID